MGYLIFYLAVPGKGAHKINLHLAEAPWSIFDLVTLAGGYCGRGVLVVFACYLDDSDSQNSNLMTLAGYVARIDAWREFEQEIAPVFKSYEIPVLHAKELHDTDGYFSGWSRQQKRSFIADIYDVAQRHVAFGISISARKRAVKKWIRSDRKNSGMSPYGMCFSSISHFVVMNNPFRRQIQDSGICFMVESGHENNPEIERAFRMSDKHGLFDGIVRSIYFVDKRSCHAIQLADFLAFHSRRFEAASDRFDYKLSLPRNELYKIAIDRMIPHKSMVMRGDFRRVSVESARNPPLRGVVD